MISVAKRLLAAAVGAAAGCGSAPPTGPSPTRIPPGLYVLSDFGGVPAPYVYERVEYGDTLLATFRFAFDSVRILNDTAFTRHFRRELIVTRPPVPPIVQSSEEFTFSGIILDRDDEFKLTVTSGALPGGHALAYFAPADSGQALLRRATFRLLRCAASCELSERRVNARYARQ